MKTRVLKLAIICLLPFMAFSQFSISGKIKDKSSGMPLPHAHISIEHTHLVVFSDINGNYSIRNIPEGTYHLKCTYVGYEPFLKEIDLNSPMSIDIEMGISTTLAEEVLIQATRSGSLVPVTQTTINKKDIAHINLGQDLPVLIKTTPSVLVTSDAGTGVGYTGIKIRGSDPTRINITVNGIPVNDSESHGVWWVNMPDFASSVENIQIQRGVGTSTNGAAAFGASINLQTNTLNQDKYATVSTAASSFNTLKNTVSFGTGLLPGKWAFDGRMSQISSDGYIDRAWSKLNSYYLSAGYYGKNDILKLIHFSGKEKTYQAWYGVPKDSLNTHRTFNPAGMYYDANGNIKYYDNETDNYQQDHYQLHYSKQINKNFSLNLAGHLTYGRGYYEQYKQNDKFSKYTLPAIIIGNDTIDRTDIIRRRWLDNYFYGTTYSLNYNNFKNLTAIFGGAYNIYDGDHFGEIIWAEISKNIPKNYKYYDNNGYKTDFNNFVKLNYALKKINVFADLQHRKITYNFLGKAIISNNIEDLEQSATYNFINPKAGINYLINPQHTLYAFWGVANREPVRDDFTSSSEQSRPKHETMNNIELGYKSNKRTYHMGVNSYVMLYKNQLVLTGEINDVGDYTRTNIENSYRAGIEIEGSFIITKKLSCAFNFTYSQNRIKEITEHYDVYDDNWNWTDTKTISYKNTPLAFSPDIISACIIEIKPFNNLNINLINKYIGSQYVDNTANKDRMLDAYLVNDVSIAYAFKTKSIKSIEVVFLINNMTNRNYITNAWVYNGIISNGDPMALEDGYFPQAGRHYSCGININF